VRDVEKSTCTLAIRTPAEAPREHWQQKGWDTASVRPESENMSTCPCARTTNEFSPKPHKHEACVARAIKRWWYSRALEHANLSVDPHVRLEV
jgi:hypothetical protein